MFPTARGIAATYNPPDDVDPWDRVEQYREAMEHSAKNPNAGSHAVASAVDQPRSRVRPWLDGARPDVVRGLDTSTEHGWLDPDPASPTARALVELAAHIMAGGSINSPGYVPSVAVGRRVDPGEIEEVFRVLGVRSQHRHEDSEGRATEILPREDGSVLGRCLVAMGVPQGSKRDIMSLPTVASEGPIHLRAAFAAIYARHRAASYPEKDTTAVRENRPREYLEALGDLFRGVTGESVTVGGRGLTLSAAAARELGVDRSATP